jgi:hypothetical protein
MQATDREEFEAQLAILCAGKDVPVTQARKDAYWRGMGRLTLAQFARCVDYALSEWSEEGMPSTSQLWSIHRGFRTRPGTAALLATPDDTRDHLLFFANRMFLRHIQSRGGLGSTGRFVPAYGMVDCKPSEELIAARAAVRDLVDWFSGPVLEGDSDATPAEFIRQFIENLDKVSPITAETRAFWEGNRAMPQSLIPFPRHMGRELDSRYARNDRLMPRGQQQALPA